MNSSFPSKRGYLFFFSLLAVVYICGLFVPLMDNDSAHHALIALRMHLTGDYFSLIDNGKDYLDKPHLHFWLCALSYKVFGVNTFAYKFPSFLFTILGTYSTYRAGKILYNKETGRLAALIVASAFAYMLANNDVRMEAILTAAIIFSAWHLIEFVNNKKAINVIAAAAGLAAGFCTKGHLGLFMPAVSILFYILYKKEWNLFIDPKWLLLAFLFFVFTSPVLYAYYIQYDLHPEKIVRGKNNISGIKFILWNQSIERFGGDAFGKEAKGDYFFFIHSFLWAFLPWSILTFIAVINRVKNFFTRRNEWVTPGVFLVMLVLIAISGFKLPHYINIIFPFAAIITAALLLEKANNQKLIKSFFIIQLIACIILMLIAAVLNAWAFPVKNFILILITILLLAIFFYIVINKNFVLLKKAIYSSAAAMLAVSFLLNTNFYPQLLTYQAGNELAIKTRNKIDPQLVSFWKNTYSSSYCFYTKTLRREISDSILKNIKPLWMIVVDTNLATVKSIYNTGKSYSHIDYEITQLRCPFINPATRAAHCNRLYLIEIISRKQL